MNSILLTVLIVLAIITLTMVVLMFNSSKVIYSLLESTADANRIRLLKITSVPSDTKKVSNFRVVVKEWRNAKWRTIGTYKNELDATTAAAALIKEGYYKM